MNARKLAQLGIPNGEAMKLAGTAVRDARQMGIPKRDIPDLLAAVVENPSDYTQDALLGDLANALLSQQTAVSEFRPRTQPAPYHIWGRNLEKGSLDQMANAVQLPVAV
ncbi:MAG: hypothetical protein KC413_16730, partial [Anaerolineales bacterium]|nr:hypothetical protein [Anaerolineales bacterium]